LGVPEAAPAEPAGEAAHRAQRVVPEGVDLDRLPDPRGHDPVPDPGVHPSELDARSEEHTSELQSLTNIVCRLLLEKKKTKHATINHPKQVGYEVATRRERCALNASKAEQMTWCLGTT